MKIDIEIGKLSELIEEFKSIQLIHNEEIDIRDLDIHIPTPTGNSIIHYIIKKNNLPMLSVILENGYSLRCAEMHILRKSGADIYAKDLSVNDEIDHLSGKVKVIDIKSIGFDDCLDINVNEPYLYYDSNGVIHHNTLICGILSHRCETYGRTIVIVPTKDLVTQTEEDYINLGLDVGVFFGDRKEYLKTHTICTWQSLESLAKKSKKQDLEIDIKNFFEGVVCVMIDECFHPDALVLTSLGYSKISDIKVGDIIINYSEELGIFKEDTVEHVYKNLTKSSNEKMYELEFDNGKNIKVTGNHKFLTQRGWVRADQITETDDIVDISSR